MLTYNTHLKRLILPGYGRNIQQMVDRCLEIEDRAERTDCAYAIAKTIETLFPPTGDIEEYRRKIWDHIAIMSDFNLDIDWPFEVIRAEALETQPEPIGRSAEEVRHRQYGKLVASMIARVSEMEEGEERSVLAVLLANQMKKLLSAINPDGVEDARVFNDLRNMSNGAIVLKAEDCVLNEYKVVELPTKKKKKK